MKSRKLVLIMILALTLFLVLSGCTEPFSSKFENLVTSAAVDEESYPINPLSVFDEKTPLIYLTGNVKDATIGSKIIAEWYYMDEEEDVLLYQLILEVTETDMGFYFSLSKPTDDWYFGDYEIILFYDNVFMERVKFSVE